MIGIKKYADVDKKGVLVLTNPFPLFRRILSLDLWKLHIRIWRD